jgi:hypothetical protein
MESIKPIKLSEFGEELWTSYLDKEYTDNSELGCCIGTHGQCDGFLSLKRISIKFNVICCRSCNFRLIIPVSIKTYGDLRKYMKSKVLNQGK